MLKNATYVKSKYKAIQSELVLTFLVIKISVQNVGSLS